jgi:UDP-N-acetylglucosamine--N-acetylmuramyl-(pentapeptide) pyrophosphoryl-undecaprenol N-acetylglucosamine transferase
MEQNLIPGQANVWLSRWASKICLSFEETRAFLPNAVQHRQPDLVVTGNPVRQSMLPHQNPPTRRPKQLLILGGSQGARHLNQTVVEWVTSRPAELEGWQLIHQTGSNDFGAVVQSYRDLGEFLRAEPVEFIADPGPFYRSATLIIARAGATSLAEIACQAAPTLLVPLPSAARDHQTANARWYASREAARLVIQSSSPSETAVQLASMANPLLSDADLREDLSEKILQTARPQAASTCAQLILAQSP